jgi:hypothetical protein
MKNGNMDFVGVAEKRELAKLLEKQYEEAIQEAVNVEKELCGQAEETTMKKLGVQLILEEISKLDRQRDILIHRIEEIGFDYNHGTPVIAKTWDSGSNDSIWKRSSPAGKEAMKILSAKTNLPDLRAQKVSVLKKLWLTTSRKEVVNLVGNGSIKVELRQIEKNPQLVSKN